MSPTRVFVEDADASRYVMTARALQRAGYEVGSFCGGRHFSDEQPSGCRLVKDGRCTLLEEADVIVFRFELDSPENRRVLETIRQRYPRKPVVVEVTPSQALEHRDLLAGYGVAVGPMTAHSLLEAIESALSRPRGC